MTTLLVLLLCVSPVSAFVMIHNQVKLEILIKNIQSDISLIKDCDGTMANNINSFIANNKKVPFIEDIEKEV